MAKKGKKGNRKKKVVVQISFRMRLSFEQKGAKKGILSTKTTKEIAINVIAGIVAAIIVYYFFGIA